MSRREKHILSLKKWEKIKFAMEILQSLNFSDGVEKTEVTFHPLMGLLAFIIEW